MQQVNLLRCRSIPMCRVVSITPPVVVELPGGADVLCGGHHSPIQGLSRALRWRFSHRSDQSPLRGQSPHIHMQPVTCLLQRSSSGAYRRPSGTFIPSPLPSWGRSDEHAHSVIKAQNRLRLSHAKRLSWAVFEDSGCDRKTIPLVSILPPHLT